MTKHDFHANPDIKNPNGVISIMANMVQSYMKTPPFADDYETQATPTVVGVGRRPTHQTAAIHRWAGGSAGDPTGGSTDDPADGSADGSANAPYPLRDRPHRPDWYQDSPLQDLHAFLFFSPNLTTTDRSTLFYQAHTNQANKQTTSFDMAFETSEECAALELFIAIRKAQRAGVQVVAAMAAVTQGMCGHLKLAPCNRR